MGSRAVAEQLQSGCRAVAMGSRAVAQQLQRVTNTHIAHVTLTLDLFTVTV